MINKDKALARFRFNEALEEENTNLLEKLEQYKAVVDLLAEMDEYLNHGHGTSIGCDSIFHQQIKTLSQLKEKG